MKRNTLLNTLAIIGAVQASCGYNSVPAGGNRTGDSVLASLGSMDTKPEGVSDLSYELELVPAVAGGAHPAAVIGTVKNSGTDAVIEFKRTTENPLLPGTTYRLTVAGTTNANLYDYLDKPRASDNKSIYHVTSIGKISDTNTLKLFSVKRYNVKGAPLFTLTLNVNNSGLPTGSKARLSCSGNEPIVADMSQTAGQFIFNFNTTHFQTAEQVTCTKLEVLAGEKVLGNKDPLNIVLLKQSASSTQDLTLEEKVSGTVATGSVSTEIVSHLHGIYVDACEVITAQLPAVDTYRTVAFEFNLEAGQTKGKASKTITAYADKECKNAGSVAAAVTHYDIELLNPALTNLADTLAISFYNVDGVNRTLETHTLVNLVGNKIRFGAAVQGSAAWSGSTDLAALPKELSINEFTLKVAAQ